MTLVFGKQELGDVFQKKCMMMKIEVTPLLHFVTGQSLIACMECSQTIVQTKTKAVKTMTMIQKSSSSVMIVKPAYQKVNSLDISDLNFVIFLTI